MWELGTARLTHRSVLFARVELESGLRHWGGLCVSCRSEESGGAFRGLVALHCELGGCVSLGVSLALASCWWVGF